MAKLGSIGDGERDRPSLRIITPVQWQVIQRDTGTLLGSPVITCEFSSGPFDIEARWKRGAWTSVTAGRGRFSFTMTGLASGQGSIEIRRAGTNQIVAGVDNIGIGEVFALAGQSNCVGYGQSAQSYALATQNVMFTRFAGDYLWKPIVTDPLCIMAASSNAGWLDAVNDNGTNPLGSTWMQMGDDWFSYAPTASVPIGWIPCAMGGTRILSWVPGADHQDRTTLYGAMVYRCLQSASSVRAVLWWQGEGDAADGTSQANYESRMQSIADGVYTDLGCSLMPCKLPSWVGTGSGNQPTINAAIAARIAAASHVIAGPDLSGMVYDDSSPHFLSNQSLATAATGWMTAIKARFSL